jgi:hypothetical protein
MNFPIGSLRNGIARLLKLTLLLVLPKEDNLKYKLQIVNETVGLRIAIIQEFINETEENIKDGDEVLVQKKRRTRGNNDKNKASG